MVPEIWSKKDNFLSFWTIFCPFTPCAPRKSNFWENEQHKWRYYNCKNVYHKWQSHDIWFLGYEMQQTEFLVISDHFLPFYNLPPPPHNLKNQNFEKLKKWPGDLSFYTHVPKIMIRWCIVPEIWCAIDRQTDGQTKVTYRGGCPSPLTNHNHMSTVPEIQSETDTIFCHFWANFWPFYPPNNQENRNLTKN